LFNKASRFGADNQTNQMKVLCPIIIVDDDIDEHEIFENVFEELEVEHSRLYFNTAEKALDFLVNFDGQPFLILSDINMPPLEGLT
jgi:two-component SAPR family response regulator